MQIRSARACATAPCPDTIQTTRFSAGEPLDNTIQSLIVSHSERAKSDPNFQWLVGGIEDYEKARSQTSVSLNIDSRIAEREEELAARLRRENERRQALNLEPLESLDDINEDELPDVLLDEAAGIVRDMAELREVDTVPSQTAQVIE